MSQSDSVWKDIVYEYIDDFLAFFFPDIYEDIDFTKGIKFLDKELSKILPESEIGKRYADILIDVYLKNGSEKWVLIHIEVQGYNEKEFAKRMYIYNYRIFDRYNKDVASLAIFTDDNYDFRPNEYKRKYWGFELIFRFPIVKILDYKDKEEELIRCTNPFSDVVLTHLKEKEVKGNIDKARFWKFSLIRNLYEKKYTKKEILDLYKFIDWIIRLPDDIEKQLLVDISNMEEVKKMPYITTAERLGIEVGIEKGIEKGLREGIEKGLREGIEKGLREGIKLALEVKFGGEGLIFYNTYIDKLEGMDKLERLKEKIKDAKSIEELGEI